MNRLMRMNELDQLTKVGLTLGQSGEVVRARMDSMIHISEALPYVIMRDLRWRISVPNPKYARRRRLGLWTGNEPSNIVPIYNTDFGQSLGLPRGTGKMLKDTLERYGKRLELRDDRVSHPPIDYTLKIQPRSYQSLAASRLYEAENGYVTVPCGGGKTIIGLEAISLTRQPALIIVHTRDLVEQWREVINRIIGIDSGMIVGHITKHRPDKITIATIQTLCGMLDEYKYDLGKKFGTVIIDEAHHIPAPIFRHVLPFMPARYIFGLTATPERDDGLSPLMELFIGKSVYDISHHELIDKGYLVKPHIEIVNTGTTMGFMPYPEMINVLISDNRRNEGIISIAAREAACGKSVLILSGRVKHCAELSRMLNTRTIESSILSGSTDRAKRKEILDQFRSGSIQVVCATTIADEGLDISRLECVILATPNMSQSRTIQRLGRLMRPHAGKSTPILYDLVDDSPITKYHHYVRSKAYAKIFA